MIQVLILAPGMALRIGLRALLQGLPDIQVCGEAASFSEVLPFPGGADVLLVAGDPAHTTIDFLQPARPERLRGLVVLSDQIEHAAALVNGWNSSALPAPAWGILSSAASPDELAAAVRAVYEGLVVAAPELLAKMLALPDPAKYPVVAGAIELTNREREVLQFLAQGLANKQIGLLLGISEHTVKFHVSGIYTKLGVTNRTEAVRVGLQQGLISL